jgi:hypothetical protein
MNILDKNRLENLKVYLPVLNKSEVMMFQLTLWHWELIQLHSDSILLVRNGWPFIFPSALQYCTFRLTQTYWGLYCAWKIDNIYAGNLTTHTTTSCLYPQFESLGWSIWLWLSTGRQELHVHIQGPQGRCLSVQTGTICPFPQSASWSEHLSKPSSLPPATPAWHPVAVLSSCHHWLYAAVPGPLAHYTKVTLNCNTKFEL